MKTILCINGSDSMGNAGIQADIRTIKDMGCCALTAITSVTVQNSSGITSIHQLSAEVVVGQVRAVCEELHPDAVKVGMVNCEQTIRGIAAEISECRCLVCSPVILSSQGSLLMSNQAIQAYSHYLLPLCTMLVVKCVDAEILLGRRITTDADMQMAASALHRMGAKWVLLRGGTYMNGRINALLSSSEQPAGSQFFSSVNIQGWQRHGVGGTLSTAITSRMVLDDDPRQAVANAHTYLHSQVVYASQRKLSLQPRTLYDRFVSLITNHYTQAHDVGFYADKLAISPRYLAQVTQKVSGRTPKQIIDDYLIQKCTQLLSTTTLSVQQVSLQLGFNSQIAFAKFFKTKKGIAPTSYRTGIAER